jgi:hypothetical protein
MPNTTNFNWSTPADTDLVKNGASAIRTLGSAIDTSFVDLKGGTTGQVLKKTSATDLDFEWGTASSGLTLINTTSFSAVASQSAPANTFSATYENYLLLLNLTSNSANDGFVRLRLRSGSTDATTSYYFGRVGLTTGGTTKNLAGDNLAFFNLLQQDNTVVGYSHVAVQIFSPFLSQKTKISYTGTATDDTSSVFGMAGGGVLDNTTSYDSFTILNENGTSTGKMSVYGYNF